MERLHDSRQSRRVCRGILHRVGDQSLHDDRRQGSAALQRGEETGRLLGGNIGPARKRRGSTGTRRWSRRWCASAASSTTWKERQRRCVHRARASSCSTVTARERRAPNTTRATCRPATVRGRRPRGARGVFLLGHGGHRGGDARSRLPERGAFALGQHREQEVLRDGRHRQRRDLGGLRPELFAAATTPTASRARAAARSSSSTS